MFMRVIGSLSNAMRITTTALCFALIFFGLANANPIVSEKSIPYQLGFGADFSNEVPRHHPMAYGFFGSAAANFNDVDTLVRGANWLLENNSNGCWSLGWSWDAFSDGSTNSADTCYAIETAVAVSALFDAYEKTGKRQYAEAALAGLKAYAPYFTYTSSGGYFWYSSAEADSIYVSNVNAMLAAQYARSGKTLGEKQHRKIAEQVFMQLNATRIEHDGAGAYWEYATNRPQSNDALHAAYGTHPASTALRVSRAW